MARVPDVDDAILLDQLSHDLFPQFEGTPQQASVRAIVAAEISLWQHAPIQDYVPIFVERRLRRTHRLARSTTST